MKQVDASHYEFTTYVTKERFASFWHQVDNVLKFNPKTVLEIGPGPGIVTDLLRKQGVKVTTVDFAEDVGADVIASVLALPFDDNSFDVVLCCQVLEHIEYDLLLSAVSEINRVCIDGAVVSLPHTGRFGVFSFWLPKFGQIRFGLPLNVIAPKHVFDGQHYWEVGKRGYSTARIRRALKSKFKKVNDFRGIENPYHHFFICKKGK